ncbi:unnamed protein product [Caretta caretta]
MLTLAECCGMNSRSTDYKVVVKAISLQLGSMLVDMVHPDQTFNNLYLILDLLELRFRDGLSFALLTLDQEKAFDRMDHGYFLGTLSEETSWTQFSLSQVEEWNDEGVIGGEREGIKGV